MKRTLITFAVLALLLTGQKTFNWHTWKDDVEKRLKNLEATCSGKSCPIPARQDMKNPPATLRYVPSDDDDFNYGGGLPVN